MKKRSLLLATLLMIGCNKTTAKPFCGPDLPNGVKVICNAEQPLLSVFKAYVYTIFSEERIKSEAFIIDNPDYHFCFSMKEMDGDKNIKNVKYIDLTNYLNGKTFQTYDPNITSRRGNVSECVAGFRNYITVSYDFATTSTTKGFIEFGIHFYSEEKGEFNYTEALSNGYSFNYDNCYVQYVAFEKHADSVTLNCLRNRVSDFETSRAEEVFL